LAALKLSQHPRTIAELQAEKSSRQINLLSRLWNNRLATQMPSNQAGST